MASGDTENAVETVKELLAVELPAPPGWKKKVAPRITGSSPKRKDIVFVAPTGEEIKSKKQLDEYLKSHPGGPSASEFDWSNTGETPRRSNRLSEKVKATESPEDAPPPKRSSSKKEAKAKKDNVPEIKEVEMKDVDGAVQEDGKQPGNEETNAEEKEAKMKDVSGAIQEDEETNAKETGVDSEIAEDKEQATQKESNTGDSQPKPEEAVDEEQEHQSKKEETEVTKTAPASQTSEGDLKMEENSAEMEKKDKTVYTR